MVDAVSKQEVDVAILWGPLVGYFAKRQPVPLDVVPVTPQMDGAVPFAYDISMGVQKRNKALRDEINAILSRKQDEINKILDDFGVPRVQSPKGQKQQEQDKD